MFGLFRKKDSGIPVTDRVVIEEAAKWKALADVYAANPRTIIVCWFEETFEKGMAWFTEAGITGPEFILAREISSRGKGGAAPVFAEHYPLSSRETALFQSLQLEKAIIYSSLREPLFTRFGSDKIIGLMRQLGMKEDELIEHTMISSAIRRAQEKIEAKNGPDLGARSQEEWMRLNGIV